MNLIPLIEKKEIAEAFSKFEKMTVVGSLKVDCFVGYQGGGEEVQLNWLPKEHIWSYFEPHEEKSKFWCIFGVDDPTEIKSPNIICEINIPFEGIRRGVAGVFAHNSKGEIFLTHSGGVAGGRKGIGKIAFWDFGNFKDVCTLDWQDGEETEAIIIGSLDDPKFQSKVAEFVYKVKEFKDFVVGE